jgi:hypothetical protein
MVVFRVTFPPVIPLLLVVSVPWLIAAAFLAAQVRLAPVGIEDAEGFHPMPETEGAALPRVVAVRVF